MTSIGDDAFYNCSALTSVVIGDSVTSIGNRAFVGCGALTECYCYATIPPSIKYHESFSHYTFPLSNNATLYVPERCGSTYKISYWGNYFNNIVEME